MARMTGPSLKVETSTPELMRAVQVEVVLKDPRRARIRRRIGFKLVYLAFLVLGVGEVQVSTSFDARGDE